jgi:phage-related protein
MNVRTACLFALIGTILAAALEIVRLLRDLINSMNGAVAPITVFTTFIFALAWTSLAVFFWAFYRRQV